MSEASRYGRSGMITSERGSGGEGREGGREGGRDSLVALHPTGV